MRLSVTFLSVIFFMFAFHVAPVSADARVPLLAPLHKCKGQTNWKASKRVQERAMLCLINHARRARGLPGVKQDRTLMRAARRKGQDIFRCDEMSHTACGREVSYWPKRLGFTCACSWGVGENLFWGFSSDKQVRYMSARAAMRGWIRSEGHRRNLLTKEWRLQGVGVTFGKLNGSGRSATWVSLFGRKSS